MAAERRAAKSATLSLAASPLVALLVGGGIYLLPPLEEEATF